jgi:hypothetical protein
MYRKIIKSCMLFSLLALPACVTIPTGPSVYVVPAAGKPFELFRQEDASCRIWAEQHIGLSPKEAADKDTATGAVVGTAVGAGLGALMGSASGHAGVGALIGAAGGMLLGTASGADSGRVYGREAQRRYDIAYLQCMYSHDNQLPESGRIIRRSYGTRTIAPPPKPDQPQYYESIPPPPPGARPQTPPELIQQPPSVTQPYDRPIPPPPPGARPQTPPEMMEP